MSQRIPCTVLTGFLGAGKTTLIQSMLRNPGGRKLALIVNEFGTADVDGDLVRSCGIEGCDDEDVLELANGCICCTVADDFLPTLLKLLEREAPPDHIVIETSGLALPQPLLQAFTWPEVRARVTVDGVVTLVDARAVADGRFAADETAIAAQRANDESLDHESPLEELFADQLSCADLVVLTKSDLVDDAERAAVEARVREGKRAAAHVINSGAAKPPIDVLLGLGVAAETDASNRLSRHEARHHGAHDHDHHHDDEHHHTDDHPHDDHGHDAFESVLITVPESASPECLRERVAAAAALPGVLRIKGVASVEGRPMRLIVQAVGPRVETYFDRPWTPEDQRDGQLVVIGLASFDPSAVEATLAGQA